MKEFPQFQQSKKTLFKCFYHMSCSYHIFTLVSGQIMATKLVYVIVMVIQSFSFVENDSSCTCGLISLVQKMSSLFHVAAMDV